jgi:hypothetical protein
MTQSGQSERPVTLVAKFSNCFRFPICSYSRLGTGPFPSPLVPIELRGWPLLDPATLSLGGDLGERF